MADGRLALGLVCSLLAFARACCPAPALADLPDIQPIQGLSPFKLNSGNRPPASIAVPSRQAHLEDLIPRMDFPISFLQPVPLAGVKIPGLTDRSVQLLGQTYFLVLDNSRYPTMAAVYRDNRLRGKSNFVTADAIVHPYFAWTNRVLADAIVEHVAPDLLSMLKAMLAASLSDYKQAEDAEVRMDLERNLAFLSVAIKLLDPKFFAPVPMRIVPWIRADLEAIESGRGTHSAIFDSAEDFSSYVPVGWYSSRPELEGFYRCREWVSRVSFPFSDVTAIGDATRGNTFRRSVLLYRSLELSRINGQPAYDTWTKLVKVWSLLGADLNDWQESTILPSEYKQHFKAAGGSLKITLNELAEPLFRTRLLLSLRKQKPLKLGAASVFELGGAGGKGGTPVMFRLLPMTGDAEWPWLKACVPFWHEHAEPGATWPFALLVTHAWGAAQANNTLLDNFARLDPHLVVALPDLDKLVEAKQVGATSQTIRDRRWDILKGYFKPLPEGAQSVLRSEPWMVRMLESAFAGWVDSHLALAPESAGSQEAGGTPPPATPTSAAPPARGRRPAPMLLHYLQPSTDIYQAIAADARQMADTLGALGYMPERLKDRLADFGRLAERLKRLSDLELKGKPLPLADIKLLQNIDVVLAQVDAPLEGTLPLKPPSAELTSSTVGAATAGMSFGLGRAGQLFIILQKETESTLGRGATYTYFEAQGAPIKPEHWQRKLDNDLLRPPFWAERFDLVQEAVPGKPKRPPVTGTLK